MSTAIAIKPVDRLATLLEELAAKQESLHRVIRGKLEAMRRADVEGMIAASHREGELANEVTLLDAQRREVAAEVCAEIGIPALERNRPASLRRIAARLGEAERLRIVKLADLLRERMLQVAEANRVVELVSREMLAFFKAVFTAIVRDDAAPRVYSACGAMGTPAGARVLDAVG
ncbi:MAG TPA: flagellar export chaperone FlgN [Phycisphaerae bacterium]|nr:flagellar export chaperone FlgN [Phycisphaerae bacterium]